MSKETSEYIQFTTKNGTTNHWCREGDKLIVTCHSLPSVERPKTLIPDRSLPHGFETMNPSLVETLVTVKTIENLSTSPFHVVVTKCVWEV